jgi:Kelch motif
MRGPSSRHLLALAAVIVALTVADVAVADGSPSCAPFNPENPQLCAVLTPPGGVVRYYFELGTSPSYGQTIPAEPVVEFEAYDRPRTPAATIEVEAKLDQGDLRPDTTYHYRADANDGERTFYGADATFTTPAAAPQLEKRPSEEATITTGPRAAGIGSWSWTGDMPLGFAEGALTTLSDGRVLAISSGGNSEQAQIYDPATGSWTLGPESPERLSWNRWNVIGLADGGALLYDERVCEYEGCVPTPDVYRSNPTLTEWEPIAPMAEGREDPVAVLLADGSVLFAGGFGTDCPHFKAGRSCLPLASAEIYDPSTDKWTPTEPMPQPRGGAVGARLSDGSVLVIGGGEANEANAGAIRYDPATRKWTMVSPTIQYRTGALIAALPDGGALALGSMEPDAYWGSTRGVEEKGLPLCYPDTSEVFSGATGTWTPAAPEPGAIETCDGSRGALLTGGQFFLGREWSNKQGALGPFLLDAEQRCWEATAPPLAERGEAGVAALPEGRVLVFGGTGLGEDRTPLASSEIYTPGTPDCTPEPPPPPASSGVPPADPPTATPGHAPAPVAGPHAARHRRRACASSRPRHRRRAPARCRRHLRRRRHWGSA